MGFIIKIITALCLVAGAFLWWSYASNGHLPVEQWRAFAARVAPAFNTEKLDSVEPDKLFSEAKQLINKAANGSDALTDSHVKMYKWKDAKGVMHFDNHPVAGAQEILVDTKTNTMPSVPTVSAENSSESKSKTMNEEVNELRAAKQKHDEQMNGL